MADLPDEILMKHVKEGNLAEMSVLFERYHVKLYNFFLRLTMKPEISQDLTQNLFYRLIRYRSSYKEGYSLKSWMYQMARNLHLDYCKEQKRSEELFLKTENFPADISDEQGDYAEDDFDRLDKAFLKLNDDQKELIVLSRYQGLKYEEISVITNKSVPAIKVAIHRAIKELKGIYLKQI